MQKIYFNPKTNHTIVDVSGIKDPKKIAEEFNIKINEYESIEADEKTEKINIKNGKLEKSLL